MGRAIVRQPDVFLFDEPLSNLDPALRSHMRVELKRLHQRLRTSIFHVTHDQIEALTLADRIVVLDKGVVQQIGSPRELFDHPANTFVAQFIGSPKMNLLPAITKGEQVLLEGTEFSLPVRGVRPEFTVGVRPSDLTLGDKGLQGEVDVVESLGHEALVHLRVGDHALLAQAPEPVGLTPGDKVSVTLGTTHSFAKDTGVRIEDPS
jgi:ABC-type sugar transport system ATPase subunit